MTAERRRWIPRAWWFHNVVAHPVSEIMWWLGVVFPSLREAATRLHDDSVPPHSPGDGRG